LPAESLVLKKLTLFACAALLALPLPAAEKAAGAQWSQESSANGVIIYSRLPSGSPFKEFKGVGVVAAPARIVYAVLSDNEAYPTFMPYIAESRVLKREKDTVLAYQRLTFPLISDRDYTVRSQRSNWLSPGGPVYRMRWEAANDLGPAARPGILRVNLCKGEWLLEQQGMASTLATYTIFTDNGGSLPAFVANSASRIGIGKIFAAVRKQVKDPKYTDAAPLSAGVPNNSR
jgi:Polyketide cyclase / dehydrase and lipid transport